MAFEIVCASEGYVLVEISKVSRGKYRIAVIDEEYPFQSVVIDQITYMMFFNMKDIMITRCRMDPVTLEELGMNIFNLPEKHRGGICYVNDYTANCGLFIGN